MGGLLGGLSTSAGPSQLDSWPLLLLGFSPILLCVQALSRPPLWASVVGTHHSPNKDTSPPGKRPHLHWLPASRGVARRNLHLTSNTSTCLPRLPQSSHTFAHHICSVPCSHKSSLAIWHFSNPRRQIGLVGWRQGGSLFLPSLWFP